MFSIFSVLSLNFENSLFFGLLKHYKIGVSAFLGFFCYCKRRKKQKKMITGISEFWFFVQKWPFRDAHLFFKKCFAETPIFMVFFGCALFGPSCQKKESLDTHPKRKKIDWELKSSFFGIFVFFGFCFCCFGPPHLALNPPCFCFCFLLFFWRA